MLHAARWKYRTQKWLKNCHLITIVQLCRAESSQLRHMSTIGKKLLNSNVSSTCSHNMANLFGPLAAEICWRVWGTPANFKGVSRHGSVTARHSSSGRQPNFVALNKGKGATYIRQGCHHVGHWPTFLVLISLSCMYYALYCLNDFVIETPTMYNSFLLS